MVWGGRLLEDTGPNGAFVVCNLRVLLGHQHWPQGQDIQPNYLEVLEEIIRRVGTLWGQRSRMALLTWPHRWCWDSYREEGVGSVPHPSALPSKAWELWEVDVPRLCSQSGAQPGNLSSSPSPISYKLCELGSITGPLWALISPPPTDRIYLFYFLGDVSTIILT